MVFKYSSVLPEDKRKVGKNTKNVPEERSTSAAIFLLLSLNKGKIVNNFHKTTKYFNTHEVAKD